MTHPMAWVQAVEKLGNVNVPTRAKCLRTIVSELERIHSHLLWAGIAAHVIGFISVFYLIWNSREKVKDLMELTTGHRANYSFNTIGGVRRDITDSSQIFKILSEVEEDCKAFIDIVMNDKTIELRTKGVGILTKEDAITYSVVGPTARASGIPQDIRKIDEPGAAYDMVDWQVIVSDGCDVFARVEVRLLEILESIKIIKELLKIIPEGAIAKEIRPIIPEGTAIGRHEAPRGEDVHILISDGSDVPFRHKIRAPSFVNLPALSAMLPDNDLANATLIVASVDPCLSCTQR